MKHFYHHIIQIDSVHIALSDLDLAPHEKDHLITIVEENIYHSVVDTLLSELINQDKKTLLVLLSQKEPDHGEIWNFIHFNIDDAEIKIKKTIEKLLKKIHEDIQLTKTKVRE